MFLSIIKNVTAKKQKRTQRHKKTQSYNFIKTLCFCDFMSCSKEEFIQTSY